MKSAPVLVRLPSRNDETIAPVTIFDTEGRVLRVVPAAEFHPPAPDPRGHRQQRARRLRRPAGGRPEPEQ